MTSYCDVVYDVTVVPQFRSSIGSSRGQGRRKGTHQDARSSRTDRSLLWRLRVARVSSQARLSRAAHASLYSLLFIASANWRNASWLYHWCVEGMPRPYIKADDSTRDCKSTETNKEENIYTYGNKRDGIYLYMCARSIKNKTHENEILISHASYTNLDRSRGKKIRISPCVLFLYFIMRNYKKSISRSSHAMGSRSTGRALCKSDSAN